MCSISARPVNRCGSLYSRLAIIHTVYERPTGRTQLKRLLILSVLCGTTSIDHEYRFFNFLFACTLYNVWRLVDLLVKLESLAGSEFRYKPLATADLFLTIANGNAGLDPLD
jgi:IS4 transposase